LNRFTFIFENSFGLLLRLITTKSISLINNLLLLLSLLSTINNLLSSNYFSLNLISFKVFDFILQFFIFLSQIIYLAFQSINCHLLFRFFLLAFFLNST